MGKEILGKLRLDAYAILMPCESKIDEVYIHLKGVMLGRGSAT